MKNLLRHIRQSLALKLSISIVLLAMPIFAASLGILFQHARHQIKKEAMERANSVLFATDVRLHGYLHTIETATNATDWLVADNLHPDSLLAYSRRIVMLNAHVSGCSITTEPETFPQYGRYFSAYSVRQGDSIATVREAEYEYFDKVWYKTPRLLEHACWIDPFDDHTEGTLSAPDMIASYCKPLYAADGRFIGVISTDLSLPQLSAIIQAEKPYPNAYFVMLGKDGHYFVHPDTMQLVSRTIFTGREARRHQDIIALGHAMTTGNTGSMRVSLDGQPCLVCYRPVHGTSWSLALVCPDNDILASYNKLSIAIWPLIALGLLTVLLLCYRVVTRAIAPLHSLLRQTQRMAAGHYDEPLEPTNRRDVVGRLHNSFAAMQSALSRHVSDIKRANDATRQRNEELRLASEQAEEAGRQKAAFVQNMTHQIRTPLNIIMGFAQVLRDNGSELPADEIRGIADMIGHNAMTLNRMVQMLYDSSDTGLAEELNSQRQELVSCNEVARESIEHTRGLFPHLSIDFSTSLPDTHCIHTSRLYLMRSLRELLYNSAKYSDGQHISLSLSANDAIVSFVFQDTGPGIDQALHEQMFRPFTKADDLSEGLGLGLPLAKRHISNLGGIMSIDTTYRNGCRFIIGMPNQ